MTTQAILKCLCNRKQGRRADATTRLVCFIRSSSMPSADLSICAPESPFSFPPLLVRLEPAERTPSRHRCSRGLSASCMYNSLASTGMCMIVQHIVALDSCSARELALSAL